MSNWYSVISDNLDYKIEWRPGTGLNLRAKYRDEEFWKYAECPRQNLALSIGEKLLIRGKDEMTYTIQEFVTFVPDEYEII